MKYLDKVKLINNKKYIDYGLKTGDIGRIICAEIRDDELYVNFIDKNFEIHNNDPQWFEMHSDELKDDISLAIKIVDLKLEEDSKLSDKEILEALPKKNPKWWCKVENGYIINLLGEKKNKIPYDYNS